MEAINMVQLIGVKKAFKIDCFQLIWPREPTKYVLANHNVSIMDQNEYLDNSFLCLYDL